MTDPRTARTCAGQYDEKGQWVPEQRLQANPMKGKGLPLPVKGPYGNPTWNEVHSVAYEAGHTRGFLHGLLVMGIIVSAFLFITLVLPKVIP